MAIDLCSESPSLGTSPRISFSHDLHHTDDVSNENYYLSRSDLSLLDSNPEFNFCVGDSIENEASSAEELFSDGLIRPLQIQERFVTSKHISISKAKPDLASLPPLPFPSPSNVEASKQETLKEIVVTSFENEHKSQSKSFWGIKRSCSLHCDNSYKKSSFWSLPLLSRSNSTGSVPNSKQASKDSHKQNSNKQHRNFAATSSSSSSSASLNMYSWSQKPPVKKNYGGPYGNGVRISPVLNVPPPYITRGTTNLFGLTSLFRNGKDKKSKK